MPLERNLMWIDEEEGWIAFDITEDSKHKYYEYIKFNQTEFKKEDINDG